MMTAKGLAIRSPTDCVTHTVSAGRLLAAMEAEAIVSYSKSRRETLVAMLGSFIGNTLALTERQASSRPRASA